MLIWLSLLVVVALLFGADFLLSRRSETLRAAAAWSAVWLAVGLAFAGAVWALRGADDAGAYTAGYVIERTLSIDNVVVFATIFTLFGVPVAVQGRALFWGIVLALVFRGAFIGGGLALLDLFAWLVYVFGVFLVWTGIQMARGHGAEVDLDRSRALRGFRRVIPSTPGYEGRRFVVRRGGRVLATPLLAVLVVIGATDLVFALDSIPAIFAVTRDPLLVFAANAFALLGLRSLYVVVAGSVERFAYLNVGLAATLVFVGAKLALSPHVHLPVWLSLLVVLALVGGAIVGSVAVRRPADRQPGTGAERRRRTPPAALPAPDR